MKKKILAMMALAAALCACSKEQMFKAEQIASPLIFTATMEDAPASKATFDNSAKCASWEVGDQVNINGFSYEANAAGTTTMFNRVATNQPREIRPVFVSTTTPDSFNNSNPPSNLVDAAGTETRWCAHTGHKVSGVWNIVVSTTQASILKTIKLWNADNQTYSGRRWKSIKVYGSSSSQSGWTELKSIENLNLAINNKGFAGEVEINATKEYTFYKIDVLENEGNDYMQMSDMKFVVYDPDKESPYTAYFPETLYNGGQTTLPSVITETWTDGKFNMPMYAQSNTTDLQFKNLCGVLKITVKSDQIAAVKKIRVSSANKATAGKFTVNSDNAAVLVNPDAVDNTVTTVYNTPVPTTAEGTTFYVAVPAQTYQKLKIDISADKIFTKSMTTKSGSDITIARNRIYPITFINNSSPALPAGSLKGEFTVNKDGKKVHFSKGNLWANDSNVLHFEDAQWKTTPASNGSKDASHVSHFTWSDKVPDAVGDSYSGSNLFCDENNKQSVDGSDPIYYALSTEEWQYLFNYGEYTSEIRKDKCRWATVNGVGGYVIAPDGFTGTLSSEYTDDAALAAAGNLVFLPAAGSRFGSGVGSVGFNGYYWSSTAYDRNRAYYVYFYSDDVSPDNYGLRNYGFCVRLITDAN